MSSDPAAPGPQSPEARTAERLAAVSRRLAVLERKAPPSSGGPAGPPGASAYDLAVANGFVGSESAWLASLPGADGDDGEPGLPGTNGTNGTNGAPGASAYDVWLAAGNTGTVSTYLAALKGATGTPGTNGTNGADGADGADGAPGASAYQVWLAAGNVGTVADYLASLKGAKGDTGDTGPAGADAGWEVGAMVEFAFPPSSKWLPCVGTAITTGLGYPALRTALLSAGSPHGTSGSDPRIPNRVGGSHPMSGTTVAITLYIRALP